MNAHTETNATSDELRLATQWAQERLLGPQAQAPFAFLYGGRPSSDFLSACRKETAQNRLDPTRLQHTFTWRDDRTGLEVRCVAVEYADFPVIEWTVYFKNTGAADTPILQDVQGLDARFQRRADSEFSLSGISGDFCTADSYQPYQITIGPQAAQRFAPVGGRPSNKAFPYYNLRMGDQGIILAIGWPGQWAASFIPDEKKGLRIVAGQELTRAFLKPGEQIRTPLIALLFWQGNDIVRSQNLWRRWFMAHNIPRIDGKPPVPMAQMQLAPTCTGSEQEQRTETERYAQAGIDIDLYWNDAGWYPCHQGKWYHTGTWEVDRQRFPNGFKPIADWIHARGKKLIVWFEPERVGHPDTRLAKNHPEWLLGGKLVNLGHPDAWKRVVERIDGLVVENGIDHYRQDFNMDPLDCWRKADAPERQGMTENLHVQGYLAFWDELRRRHPAMLIDSCASGGRRNDLETLRRAVPLLRSDFQPPNTWEAQQAQTYGLSFWIPFYGSGVYSVEKYPTRSFYMPCFGLGGNQDMTKAKAVYDECRKIAPMMLGDFYPLSAYSLQLDQWIAWQFDQSDRGCGVVQAFRRDQCEQTTMAVRLRGLDPAARYELTDCDVDGTIPASGKDLMDAGLTVTIKDKPGAAVIVYRRIK